MWAYEKVFYQFYPMGFCGAPFENDGNLEHRILKVIDFIPHLKKMGIGAVYFSPIFESDTHGYNTRDYRKIDKVTDVLSFPMYDGEEVDVDFGAISLGDIVVSIERASDQAKDFGHSLEREVCFLVCHSMFHLLGYDHMEEEEAKEMRAKEEAVLSQLGITRN